MSYLAYSKVFSAVLGEFVYLEGLLFFTVWIIAHRLIFMTKPKTL